MIEIQVPATTANLGCGFDVVGMAVDLYYTVRVKQIERGLSIVNRGEGSGFLPEDERNLFFRVVKQFWNEVAFTGCGIQADVLSEIPVSRGLGSSAACVVAGLVAGNALAGDLCTRTELMTLAARFEGHPDNVVPAFTGGLTTAYLTSNEVVYRRYPFFPDVHIVACIPTYSLYTSGMRQVLPEKYVLRDIVFNLSRLAHLVGSVAQTDRQGFFAALDDVLHEPYRGEKIVGYRTMKNFIENNNLGRMVISGSGPTLVLFLYDDLSAPSTKAIRKIFQSCGVPNIQMIRLHWVEEGVRVSST